TLVLRRQQVGVPVLALRCRSIQDVDRPLAVGEGAQTAAAACAGVFGKGSLLRGKGLAVVGRAGHPNAAMRFLRFVRLTSVPDDVDVAGIVGRDGATAVEFPGCPEYVSLRLEGGAFLIHPGVEHPFIGLALSPRAVPGDMHSPILADREVSAANVADGYGTAALAVDLDGIGEFGAVLGANVEDIALVRCAPEVNHVNDAFAVHDDLRLNAPIG